MDVRRLPVYRSGELDVPFVIAGTHESVVRETLWENHSHPTHELLWNDRGASTATVGTRTWTVTATTGLWIPAGLLHRGRMSAGTVSRAAQFNVSEAQPLSDRPVAVDITPLLRLLLDRVSEEALSPRSRATTEAMILDVLVPSPREVVLRVPSSHRLAPLVATILERPDDTTTLAQWSIRLNLSTRTLTRMFHSETGVGYTRWVATVRAQRAIDLLARGEDMHDIATAVGFASASSFGAAFRRVTGVNPGAFRDM
ncbi:helix-turn-helix transcriptional regulator [Rhodococcus sp. BP-349]|nr:helix-turn-helix transcriptional regulator [Rhodococcus sp. BP-363]MBY6542798.1 helix-turn-helix transcriptional regulator [Rhodococcus sp. BP-369]MBY6562028.1 helix-turn-helix transcriptional regulator [Rhodococcus sp. BP-370]MBY6576320.1 helix-turn-helix transcriptional regulator [Rhodococcus sp. BP-364]MBY6585621.1 helix-turn-helix transcriptional regulator [Rhodococcus sp. BP-358]MBY6589958.1 helix-turn-helix transcriptional regulator [Rhodococcus sp. BP-362]MBY6593509.1 helix-turn-hel